MSANEHQIAGGGIVVDISGLIKPAKFQPIIKRCGQYIDAMLYAKKPVGAITIKSCDYSAIIKHLQAKAKEDSAPEVVGLRYREVPIRSAGV